MHNKQLEKAFIADHRKTTKALKNLKAALAANDDVGVQEAAEYLDRVAGPHIAFEEQWLYPLVAESRGDEFQHHMVGEHDEVLEALTEIRTCEGLENVSEARKAEWQKNLQTGLDHVVTCGTLLSHLSVLNESDRIEMLQRLKGLRDEGPLWTELVANSVV